MREHHSSWSVKSVLPRVLATALPQRERSIHPARDAKSSVSDTSFGQEPSEQRA